MSASASLSEPCAVVFPIESIARATRRRSGWSRRFGLLATSALCIGSLCGQSQPALATGLVELRDGERQFRTVFGDRFERKETWRAGWNLAIAMGGSVAPLLRGQWERERADDRTRLVLAVAHALAAGPRGDEFLFERLRRSRDRQEQVALAMFVALGPERDGEGAEIVEFLDRSRDPVQQVAGILALRRLPNAPASLDRSHPSDDPGIAAAAQFARPKGKDRALAQWFEGTLQHRDLVQRGYLLGVRDASDFADHWPWLRAASSSTADAQRALRLAAAACLQRLPADSDRLRQLGVELSPDQVAVLAVDPRARKALAAAGLLRPPPDRIDPALRARLAVAFALECDIGQWRDGVARWSDGQLAPALCLGLAWRLFGEPAPEPAWASGLPDVPEAEWVRVAVGAPTAERPRVLADERLDRALLLARDGRLPRDAARGVLERALWTSRAHPGLSRFEIEVELVRDLLIAGSIHVSASLGRVARDQYLPKGIAAGDERFYSLALEICDYVRDRAPWPPPGPGLR